MLMYGLHIVQGLCVFVLYFYKHISNLIKEILRLGLIPGHGKCIGTGVGVAAGIIHTFCPHQD